MENMDIKQITKEFIDHLAGKGRSDSTLIAYKKDIEQLLQYVTNNQKVKKYRDITTEMLQSYIDKLTNSGEFTLKTISRKINSLKTFFKYLHNAGVINSNPGGPIKHPKFQMQLPRVLSSLEYRALRDTARGNSRLYTMVELLLQTGMRIGELSRLKRGDVITRKNHVYLHIERFSSNPARTIELNEFANDALQKYLSKLGEGTPGSFLFFTKNGNPVLIRNIRTAINRAFNKAGISKATVNDIRNTFIVYQLQNGVRLEKVAEFVGHRKPTTTEKYLQMVGEKNKKESTKILPL